jgi:hypothetical protein
MNNKTIIEFGLRRIPELLDLGQCYLPQPSASADNIDLGLNNSGYPAQPHPIIVKYLEIICGHYTHRFLFLASHYLYKQRF